MKNILFFLTFAMFSDIALSQHSCKTTERFFLLEDGTLCTFSFDEKKEEANIIFNNRVMPVVKGCVLLENISPTEINLSIIQYNGNGEKKVKKIFLDPRDTVLVWKEKPS